MSIYTSFFRFCLSCMPLSTIIHPLQCWDREGLMIHGIILTVPNLLHRTLKMSIKEADIQTRLHPSHDFCLPDSL